MLEKPVMRLATVVLALLLAACGAAAPQAIPAPPPTGEAPRGKPVEPVQPAPDFTLTDQQGRPFRLADQQGSVVVLYFGYTNCPDVCPLTTGLLANASKQLGDSVGSVRFVFVTADPARDTAARLGEFLGRFSWAPGAAYYGLSGSEPALTPIWNAYNVGVAKGPITDGNYAVNHSARVWLIDRQGQLRLYHLLGATADSFVNDIRWLLRQPA